MPKKSSVDATFCCLCGRLQGHADNVELWGSERVLPGVGLITHAAGPVRGGRDRLGGRAAEAGVQGRGGAARAGRRDSRPNTVVKRGGGDRLEVVVVARLTGRGRLAAKGHAGTRAP